MSPKTKPKNTVETQDETAPSSMYQASRKILLAALGAVALAQDEMDDFVNRLVERGEIAEKEGNSLLHELRERRNKRIQKLEIEAGKHLSHLLEHMDLPSKRDLDTLTDKIASLSRKVDSLQQRDS